MKNTLRVLDNLVDSSEFCSVISITAQMRMNSEKEYDGVCIVTFLVENLFL